MRLDQRIFKGQCLPYCSAALRSAVPCFALQVDAILYVGGDGTVFEGMQVRCILSAAMMDRRSAGAHTAA